MGSTDGGGRDPLWTRGAWLLPAALLAAVLAAPHAPLHVAWPWVPSLGIEAAFHFDGLNRLFLLLITGIGTLVFLMGVGNLSRIARELMKTLSPLKLMGERVVKVFQHT